MPFPELGTPIEDRTSLLIHARNGALAFGFAAATASLLGHDQVLLYIAQGNFRVIDVFRLAVYTYLFFLGVFWYYTGSHELQLLQRWLKPIQFIPRRPITHITVVLALGLLIGVMFAFVMQIWIFSIIYFLYLLFDIFTWRVRMDEIKIAIDGARRTLKSICAQAEAKKSQETLESVHIYESATDIIEAYYIQKPHIRRIISVAIPVGILAVLANFVRLYFNRVDPWVSLDKHVLLDVMRGIFYTLFLLLVIVHEKVLAKWRREMADGLNPLEAQLRQRELDAQLTFS